MDTFPESEAKGQKPKMILRLSMLKYLSKLMLKLKLEILIVQILIYLFSVTTAQVDFGVKNV